MQRTDNEVSRETSNVYFMCKFRNGQSVDQFLRKTRQRIYQFQDYIYGADKEFKFGLFMEDNTQLCKVVKTEKFFRVKTDYCKFYNRYFYTI